MGKDGTEVLDGADAPADQGRPRRRRGAQLHRGKLVFWSAIVIAAVPFVAAALAMSPPSAATTTPPATWP